MKKETNTCSELFKDTLSSQLDSNKHTVLLKNTNGLYPHYYYHIWSVCTICTIFAIFGYYSIFILFLYFLILMSVLYSFIIHHSIHVSYSCIYVSPFIILFNVSHHLSFYWMFLVSLLIQMFHYVQCFHPKIILSKLNP